MGNKDKTILDLREEGEYEENGGALGHRQEFLNRIEKIDEKKDELPTEAAVEPGKMPVNPEPAVSSEILDLSAGEEAGGNDNNINSAKADEEREYAAVLDLSDSKEEKKGNVLDLSAEPKKNINDSEVIDLSTVVPDRPAGVVDLTDAKLDLKSEPAKPPRNNVYPEKTTADEVIDLSGGKEESEADGMKTEFGKEKTVLKKAASADLVVKLTADNAEINGRTERKIKGNIKSEVNTETLSFPPGFLWGTATSAYQVEGGNVNDWKVWERSMPRLMSLMKQKKNSYEYICGPACDSYNRYEEDFDLALALNNNAIRIGLEWSRLQPQPDTWNIEAIDHYRDVLHAAKKRGLTTVVTLWHWTNPLWIADQKGWENKETVKHFLAYVDLVINELGAYIDYWVILNEPLMVIGHGYLDGKFPPNHHGDLFNAFKLFKNFVRAHMGAYSLIHKHFPGAQVGAAMTTGYFEPAHKWNLVEVAIAKVGHYLRNLWYLNRLKGYFDYIGVNYYHHDRMIWYPPFRKNLNQWTNDFGWETAQVTSGPM